MHCSIILLAVASSAFAIPVLNGVIGVPVNNEDSKGFNGIASHDIVARDGGIHDLVNVPTEVKAPVNDIVAASAKADAPVKAAVANVNVDYVDVADGDASGNKVFARDGPITGLVNVPATVEAPVDGVVGAAVKADAPVEAAVANVNVDHVDVADGDASGNKVFARDGPITGLVNVPATVEAPVDPVVDVVAKVAAPVGAAIGNVNAQADNIGDNALLGNTLVV